MSDNINEDINQEEIINDSPSEEDLELIEDAKVSKQKSENIIDKIIEFITGFSPRRSGTP